MLGRNTFLWMTELDVLDVWINQPLHFLVLMELSRAVKVTDTMVVSSYSLSASTCFHSESCVYTWNLLKLLIVFGIIFFQQKYHNWLDFFDLIALFKPQKWWNITKKIHKSNPFRYKVILIKKNNAIFLTVQLLFHVH